MQDDPADPAIIEIECSQAAEETLHDWWDRAHQVDSILWLTGSAETDVWRRLGVEDRLTPRVAVLNIGVGLGRDTRALVERGCDVQVLDISPTALRRVADVAPGWLAGTDLPTATFDLALSHLVSQHMGDDDLQDQLRRVVASLKPTGIFALQFAYAPADPEFRNTLGPSAEKAGGVLRSPRLIAEMAAMAGGRVVRDWQSDNFGAAAFHTAHIAPSHE